MRNETIKNFAKNKLKELLPKCTEEQQLFFKRMYCHKDLEMSINDAVDQMAEGKIDHALTQVERTILKSLPKETTTEGNHG